MSKMDLKLTNFLLNYFFFNLPLNQDLILKLGQRTIILSK